MRDYQVKTETIGGQLNLLITHNGNTWSGIRIVNPEYEIPKIIEVLKDTLKQTISKAKKIEVNKIEDSNWK